MAAHAAARQTRLGLRLRAVAVLLPALLAAGCTTTGADRQTGSPPLVSGDAAAAPGAVAVPPDAAGSAAVRRSGGYYLDDGPGARTEAEMDVLAALPDPAPYPEPLHPRANRPYRVLDNDYRPMTGRHPFVQQGVASWYGRRFHGQPTSIGERYDMYRMTAAHPTLPIPSFVRVTNLENGRQVVVRVNDRGPFLHERVIDLSYLAAHKLGYAKAGSARVRVELLDPPHRPAMPLVRHYLQLGAFSAGDSAAAAMRSLRRQLDWLAVPIAVTSADDVHRVQAGPFEHRDDAVRSGKRIESSTGLRPVLVAR